MLGNKHRSIHRIRLYKTQKHKLFLEPIIDCTQNSSQKKKTGKNTEKISS